MSNSYTISMREHLAQLESELTGLSHILDERALGRYEYRAAERTLQILVEACIGIAKHWSKKLTHVAPADAYTAFQNLSGRGIHFVDDVKWRSIIGMRNALVHDYLNIEPAVIESVLQSRQYKQLVAFALAGLKVLD